MSSESNFAYSLKYNTYFIVRNISGGSETSPFQKTISIFNYPINFGDTRDLLQIPGIEEADIRASLLKGVLRHKLLCGDIELVLSSIDLLQFDDNQRNFLISFGIVNGTQITNNNLAVIRKDDITLVGAINGTNTIFNVPNVFIQNSTYKIIVYLNGVKQVYLDDYTVAENGGPGTGYNTVVFSNPPTAIPLPPDVITADYYISNT